MGKASTTWGALTTRGAGFATARFPSWRRRKWRIRTEDKHALGLDVKLRGRCGLNYVGHLHAPTRVPRNVHAFTVHEIHLGGVDKFTLSVAHTLFAGLLPVA